MLSPFVIQAGAGLPSYQIGFQAYSLTVDNFSNQWLQEQSTQKWIPPYTIGRTIQLYGTQVAQIANQVPVAETDTPAIRAGEYTSVCYFDFQQPDGPGIVVSLTPDVAVTWQISAVGAPGNNIVLTQPAVPKVTRVLDSIVATLGNQGTGTSDIQVLQVLSNVSGIWSTALQISAAAFAIDRVQTPGDFRVANSEGQSMTVQFGGAPQAQNYYSLAITGHDE